MDQNPQDTSCRKQPTAKKPRSQGSIDPAVMSFKNVVETIQTVINELSAGNTAEAHDKLNYGFKKARLRWSVGVSLVFSATKYVLRREKYL